jgi:hypothetical protein
VNAVDALANHKEGPRPMLVAICLLLLAPICPAQKSSAPKYARLSRAQRHDLFLAPAGTTNCDSQHEPDRLAGMINSEQKSGAWITWTVLFVAIACATLALYAIPVSKFAG